MEHPEYGLCIVYVTNMNQKWFTRMDELAKFSIGTLKWVLENVKILLSQNFYRHKRLSDDDGLDCLCNTLKRGWNFKSLGST